MNPHRLLLFLLLILIAPAAVAQTAEPAPTPAIEQNEAFRDTLVKMRIAREESEHKKLVEKANQLSDNVGELTKMAANGKLPRSRASKAVPWADLYLRGSHEKTGRSKAHPGRGRTAPDL